MISYRILRHDKGEKERSVGLPGVPDSIPDMEILWVDVVEPSDEEIKGLQSTFGLDEYAIEDVLVGNQRPKIEQYEKNNFSVIHVPVRKQLNGEWEFDVEELFGFFQKKWLITVHREESETVKSVIKRTSTRGLSPYAKIPTTDLLYYIFLDFAVDAFYPMLDHVGDSMEVFDREIIEISKRGSRGVENITKTMTTISNIREQLMFLRNTLAPSRDMVSNIMRGAVPFVATTSLRNFRDVYDHTFQLIETTDSFMDRTNDLRGLYLSVLSASTDSILRLLAIVSTIFLPLTLLAGIYGMNFTMDYLIPGTGMKLGFYILISAMIGIAGILAAVFRKYGWI